MKPLLLISFILAGVFTACSQQELGQAPVPENYEEEIEQWKADRLESLTAPTGWMRLAGMYWLDEGENTFGSGPENDVRFPEGTIPETAGTFYVENDRVRLSVSDDVEITHDGNQVDELVVFDDENAPELEYGTLHWFIIKRGDLLGIRLYNKENEKVDQFTGFDSYPVDPEWRREARFIPSQEGTTIPIINILGQLEDLPSPGTLEFTVDGERYTLDAIESTERMFIILGDETNRTETYQAGRYMYIDYPEDGSNRTVVDFNKAYNPPCSYSKFTTCQLPPPQNRLDVEITAGELRPVDWDGI